MSGDQTISTDAEPALIDLAVECWRFSRVYARAVTRLDVAEAQRFVSQRRYFENRLAECLSSAGLALVHHEGETFDTGMAVSALNIADFGPDEPLIVDQMIEPIVMAGATLKRPGTVMLRKAGP